MTPDEYQERAHSFAQHGSFLYPYFGLAEEAGEVCGKMAKFIRSHNGQTPMMTTPAERDEFIAALSKELGDCMWMIAEIATLNGLPLGLVMGENIAKLEDRARRGVIDGNGDDR